MFSWNKLALVCATMLFLSCEKDVMTQLPVERTGLEDIFNPKDKEGNLVEEFVASIYAQLPRGFNRVGDLLLDAGTDDAVNAYIGLTPVDRYFTGQWGPSNLPENPWGANYAAIRRVNILLANIQLSGMPDLRKESLKNQARALRCIFYFELLKRWGGVPLVGDRVFAISDDLNIARSTREQVMQYILDEVTAIVDQLPATLSTGEVGRMSKGVLLALKSRMLLYDASPLYNATNDLGKWKLAADAAQALMQTNSYSLEGNFGTMFTTRSNKEVILAFQQADNTTVESLNEPPGFRRAGKGLTNPTQNLVDAFPMKNGKMIHEAGSGYNPATPYANRDPRFYLTIFHHGMSWLGQPLQMNLGGVNNLKPGAGSGTETGYYMRKFMTTSGSATSFSNATHNFPIFRYAEILLNYAEAQNEYLANPDATVYTAINVLRKRAGTGEIASGSLDQEQMRTLIRNERRIELAFEEHRFWDIRRWKTAEVVLNGVLKGVAVMVQPDGAVSYNFAYPVQAVQFDKNKMYLYPIPYTEILKNNQLTQNPGWN